MNLSDLNNWLDKIPAWKNLKNMPERVSNLENKISVLEEKLKLGKPPTCPFCFKGEQLLERRRNFARAGRPVENQTWKCQNPDCGKIDQREILLK